MNPSSLHNFHIPVMGLAFTIDTPVKIARFGISSVVSVIDDKLLESMREFYCAQEQEAFIPITDDSPDCRAARVSAYLNLLESIVNRQTVQLRKEDFSEGNDIVKYFELLPDNEPVKILYAQMHAMPDGPDKTVLQEELRERIVAGDIDVNIMTKVDKNNYAADGAPLDAIYSDAMSALRGFATSNLHSSVVFSAGLNPRLYSYCESFPDFFPDENGSPVKRIILKVSDLRSAMIQGKFFAKKGLWVSEFRIESGLNCGGHAFATEGHLLGPILEEFKLKKDEMAAELFASCQAALAEKGKRTYSQQPVLRVTVQGGIGTARENDFLLEHYRVNSTGWGSPFLLVPEATNVDERTLEQLVSAQKEDYFLSHASPLGVRFNNFRSSSSIELKNKRIEKGRPGSPCYNKFLSFNTEFSEKPVCTASRQYQDLKIIELEAKEISPEERAAAIDKVLEKECLCQGLASTAFLKNDLPVPHKTEAVSICPGPNLAYFSGRFSLREMIDHIYGRKDILNTEPRPNMFINELNLYMDYLRTEIDETMKAASARQTKYLESFRSNLLKGIEYYKSITQSMIRETEQYRARFQDALLELELSLQNMQMPQPVLA